MLSSFGPTMTTFGGHSSGSANGGGGQVFRAAFGGGLLGTDLPTITGDASSLESEGFVQVDVQVDTVAGTRVWISQSNDEGQTWKNSLAVDDSATGQIVSMQVAYAGLDTAGNLYVLYPESKGAYPDYSGGGVKYKFAAPQDDAT